MDMFKENVVADGNVAPQRKPRALKLSVCKRQVCIYSVQRRINQPVDALLKIPVEGPASGPVRAVEGPVSRAVVDIKGPVGAVVSLSSSKMNDHVTVKPTPVVFDTVQKQEPQEVSFLKVIVYFSSRLYYLIHIYMRLND